MHHTREVPREVWSDYLTLLSSITRAQCVRIEAGSLALGEQTLAQRLPLRRHRVRGEGQRPGAIEVTVGRPGEEITHRILHPGHVYADEGESGELECLYVQDAERTKTLIFFEPSEAYRETSEFAPAP